MNIWTSKPALAGLALCALAGCDAGPAAGLLGGLANVAAPKAIALNKAQMAGGKITVAAPQGYCIDRRSLTPDFALLARCDVLQADMSGQGMPLGVITVSLSPGAQSLPTPDQTANALGLADVSDTATSEASHVFRATGPAPFKGMAATQWRGTTLIGGTLMGVAFYQPDQSPAGSGAGKGILLELIAGTLGQNG